MGPELGQVHWARCSGRGGRGKGSLERCTCGRPGWKRRKELDCRVVRGWRVWREEAARACARTQRPAFGWAAPVRPPSAVVVRPSVVRPSVPAPLGSCAPRFLRPRFLRPRPRSYRPSEPERGALWPDTHLPSLEGKREETCWPPGRPVKGRRAPAGEPAPSSGGSGARTQVLLNGVSTSARPGRRAHLSAVSGASRVPGAALASCDSSPAASLV